MTFLKKIPGEISQNLLQWHITPTQNKIRKKEENDMEDELDLVISY